MGTSKSGGELSLKMLKFAASLPAAERKGLLAAGLVVKKSTEASLRLSGVKSGRLRNVGKKGARLGVRVTPRGTKTVEVRATGPWHLVENDTAAHDIMPKSRQLRRSRIKPGSQRAKALKVPGVGPRASVRHPGTKGKQPWAKGVAAATGGFGVGGGTFDVGVSKRTGSTLVATAVSVPVGTALLKSFGG